MCVSACWNLKLAVHFGQCDALSGSSAGLPGSQTIATIYARGSELGVKPRHAAYARDLFILRLAAQANCGSTSPVHHKARVNTFVTSDAY